MWKYNCFKCWKNGIIYKFFTVRKIIDYCKCGYFRVNYWPCITEPYDHGLNIKRRQNGTLLWHINLLICTLNQTIWYKQFLVYLKYDQDILTTDVGHKCEQLFKHYITSFNVKEFLKDPSKFAVAPAAAPVSGESSGTPVAAAVVEEAADESDGDMGFDLFG